MHIALSTPSLTDFAPDIATLFDAAFSRQASRSRPIAADWVTKLDALEASLEQCSENSLHYAPKDATECAWCDMEKQLGTVLFLPYCPTATLRAEAFDPGAGGFNIDLI